MESSIGNAASKIKEYLTQNNLGNYEDEKKEHVFKEFSEKFSLKYLKSLSGKDLLNNMFMDNKSLSSLCYHLEYNKEYSEISGGIKGGSITKYPLYVSSETNQWTTGQGNNSKSLSEEEAIELATKIRDAVVEGAEYIESKKTKLNSIEDYVNLGKQLKNIFENCNAKSTYAWVHKYYVLLFPDIFPRIHNEKMKRDMLKKFNIVPLTDYYAKDGQLSLLSRQADIKLYSLFNNDIVRLFYKKGKTVWDPYEPDEESEEEIVIFESDKKRNVIYFGAPGTGKSFTLEEDKNELLLDFANNYSRVTFHPDYSYANFVGTYKPVPIKENKETHITYEYVPGPFMRLLVKALDKPNEPFLLIIEEINRANVAAVFGDIFQLLDRKEDYTSRYPIDASIDAQNYLESELKKTFNQIEIPGNMFIWATMNSADQGVFPMDTAFKRRWNFKYFGINENENKINHIKVTIHDKEIYWNKLRKAINKELTRYKINEDKHLGPFFAFEEYTKVGEIPIEEFVDIFKNKIIMYLFEDAARSKRNKLFNGVKEEEYEGNISYSEICEKFDEIDVDIFNKNIRKNVVDDE